MSARNAERGDRAAGAMSAVEEHASAGEGVAAPVEYAILKQRVDLDVNFAEQSLKGSTELTIQPHVKHLREIKLHCRQCKPIAVQVGGITATFDYDDPYRTSSLPGETNIHQHGMLREKIALSVQPARLEQPASQPELSISLPKQLKIQELHIDPVVPAAQEDADAAAGTELLAGNTQQQGLQFAPIKLTIDFTVERFRDGVHWVGCDGEDKRFPYMYSKAERWAGNTSSIFPCVDDATSRCSWEFVIRSPRTVGAAFSKPKEESTTSHDIQVQATTDSDVAMTNGVTEGFSSKLPASEAAAEYLIELDTEDASLDLNIVCVGDQTDDTIDAEDETRHTVTFSLTDPVTARHVGFAIGPFEYVDLSASREAESEERLGQSAVKVGAYCLPGRSGEVRNTCFPVSKAIDDLGVAYGSFPFASYQMVFVDDFKHDAVAIAGVSFCSTNLLFSESIIELLEPNTRIIYRSVAEQWMGVNLVAKDPEDQWIIAGIAGYMADLYGKTLFGTNTYRWQQKLAAERVYDLDVDRPPISQLGKLLHLDPTVRDFLNLKSTLVLFILDRRMMKAHGHSGVQRIINRILLQAKTGSLVNGELSTADFQRTCEKLGHNKLESFFKQWVFGAGCPIFYVTQKFNKKKLVVEMTIMQRQLERKTKPPFEASNFMREVKEHILDVWAPEVQPVFTGPMTIRIHEADGTPYEHIVEIKEQITKLEIPYNTKYKRLKRSRRQKERAQMASGEGTGGGDGADEQSLFTFGDILDTAEDRKEWNLLEWTAEDEEKMGQESYEWIRMDADFEWIGKIHLVMPLYMYISQLQQDKDLVAQYESMRFLLGSNPHHTSLTILTRTLMDRRYFHGIREMAANGLAALAQGPILSIGQLHLEKAFQELYCFPGEIMPKPNDWSNRQDYIMQCAIPKAMAKLRDKDGKVPMTIRQFFVDKLKFNDNASNLYSDCHYVATLMGCLADSLVASHRVIRPEYTFSFGGGDDEPMEPENPDEPFEKEAIGVIERFRRMDEWDPTYQNIYSTSALECLQKLTRAGIVKNKAKEILLYTRESNADLVRLQAFRCLTETGVTRKMSMMRHLLHSLVTSHSPFFRDRLLAIFGQALGHIALGDADTDEPTVQAAPSANADALVLEEETTNEARILEATRKTTPEGALSALKIALGQDEQFQSALWYAATSPDIGLDEIAAFCDIAALMFEEIKSCKIAVRLPRSYRCERVDRSVVRFIPQGAYRTKPRKELAIEDYHMLQELGLAYSGPIAPMIETRRKSSAEEVSLKWQLAEMQAKPLQTQMGPPPMTISTPTIEKSGIKITLGGGAKRKQSMEPSTVTGRASSPKAAKLSKQQTPGGAGSPPMKRSPSVSSQRRGSTPRASISKNPLRGKLVVLRVSKSMAVKIQDIQAKQPRAAGSSSTLQSTTNGTAQPQSVFAQPPSSFLSPGLHRSPSLGNNFFDTGLMQQPGALNLGAFRSYGAPAVLPSPSTGVKVESPASITSPSAPPIGLDVKHAVATPSDAKPLGTIAQTAEPPKKKVLLSLKLGRKPSMPAPH